MEEEQDAEINIVKATEPAEETLKTVLSEAKMRKVVNKLTELKSDLKKIEDASKDQGVQMQHLDLRRSFVSEILLDLRRLKTPLLAEDLVIESSSELLDEISEVEISAIKCFGKMLDVLNPPEK